MFRSIISQTRNLLELSMHTLKLCTKTQFSRPRRLYEINNVNIIGTLITDTDVLHTGTKSFTVKIKESPEHYSVHNIRAKTEANFLAGQRISVSGKLKSIVSQTNDGKNLPNVVIKAEQLCLLNNDSSTDADLNSVELLSHICDVANTERDSFVLLTTNYKYVNKIGKVVTGKHFHRVYARDEALREYVRYNLKRGDRTLVNGRIAHRTYMFDNREKITGFIIAEKMFKISHRAMQEIESTGNDEEKIKN